MGVLGLSIVLTIPSGLANSSEHPSAAAPKLPLWGGFRWVQLGA